MKENVVESAWRGVASRASRAFAVTLFAVWIGICAAAPELIWRGLALAVHRWDGAELASALLIGVTLAFFVEPLLERVRDRLRGGQDHAGEHGFSSPLFAISASLAFALVSISVHEALSAFIHGGEPDSPFSLVADGALRITLGWAIAPFVVALAWRAVGRLWLAVPLGILAAAAPVLAGWQFDWGLRSTVAATIPALAILALGYRLIRLEGTGVAFARFAPIVAWVAVAWLALGLLFDAIAGAAGAHQLVLYDFGGFFIDARFYFGWALGLIFVPRPHSG